MNNIKNNEQPLDPKLIEKIELMRATPERDSQSVAQGRERFLSELEGLSLSKSGSPIAWLSGLLNPFFNRSDQNSMSTKTQKLAFSTIIAVVFVAVVLFGGVTATAYASQSSLPGDGLYPVKTSLELAQVALEGDDYSEVQLHLLLAQKRMDEINALLLKNRNEDVEIATNEFEYQIQQAFEDLAIVIANDPELGAELSKQMSDALLEYAISLKTLLFNSPDIIKPAVENALLTSQDGVGEELEIFGKVEFISDSFVEIEGEAYVISDLTEFKDFIGLGDMVKIHVILTADGTKIVREIELFSISDDDQGEDEHDEDDEFTEDDNDGDHDDGDDYNGDGDDDDDENHDDDDIDDSSDDDDSDNGDEEEHGEEDSDDSGENESDDDDSESNDEEESDSDDDDESDESDDDKSGSSEDDETDESDDEEDDEDKEEGDD